MATLSSGTHLGPYEIIDALGAGGMGEVYKARDTRLDRIVAIKVLAANLATDITSRERFEREAKAISSLNHPNICVLHDVGREKPSGSDGPAVDFIVMEYLEGETLSARLARGPSRASRQAALSRSEATAPSTSPPPPGPLPPMTVEEALAIAIQIAAALDRAHRQGVVHRDLKPGNVMITNGAVKLLDFGLARLSRSDDKGGLGHGMVSLADLSMPTVSSPLTLKGTILGTLQYMAPEQLEGKEVDARADIFAFGDMLYEMLTGRKAFDGKSQASLIGAILDHQPPPVTTYQPVSPPILDEIVSRCLAKDPDERWQTARDLKRQLEWVSTRLTDGSALPSSSMATARPSRGRSTLALGAAVLAGAALTGLVAWVLRPRPAPPPRETRFAITLPEGQNFTRAGRHAIALSPDGRRLVYVANQQLYLRSMDDLTAKVVAGTEIADPIEPVFSPDGEWIAYWTNGELRKVPSVGGAPTLLGKVDNPYGASWQGDRIILGQTTVRGIVEMPASGGEPKVLVKLGANEWAQGPQLVAGGRAILFALRTGGGSWDGASIVVQDLATGKRSVLVAGGTDPHLLPSGTLVYVREATLYAIPFDEERLAVSGSPVPVERGIRQAPINASGAAQWSWSAAGTAAYIPGDATNADRVLLWLDRKGQEERASAPARSFNAFPSALRISPDGSRVALIIDANAQSSVGTSTPASSAGADVWIWDIKRGTLTRLSFTNQAASPVWAPDGNRVCYRNNVNVVCQNADGSGKPETLATVPGMTGIRSFSPDGKTLLGNVVGSGGGDIVVVPQVPSAAVRPLIETPFNESSAAISPDGRWLAYQSNETGRVEVYVRPFPNVDQGRWQVSVEGGAEPRWARDGHELYFFTGGGPAPRVMWAAQIEEGQTFVAGKPVVIGKPSPTSGGAYDVGPDGRFLMNGNAGAAPTGSLAEIIVVEHALDEIRSRVRPAPK